ncbi:MAG: thymidylate synthase [Corynebacterium sp.]|nr:thymidylate synthase [Corynebacterium sp.]
MTNAATVATPYEDLLREVLENGARKSDRTGTGTRSLFGKQLRYDLSKSFPLLTTKKVYFHGVIGELLWFLRGESNISWLQDNNIRIWNEWADENGELGPVYGVQWRSWPTPDGTHIDQIAGVMEQLTTNPDSRRIVVSAWNVAELSKMALEPCHLLFQLYVAEGKLSMQVYQRSADMFLGVPFNIASYAALTHMFAQQAGLGVGELVWTGGDCHIYDNHIGQVKEQLSRTARPYPQLKLIKAASIFDYDFTDFEVIGYDPHPTITAPVAI